MAKTPTVEESLAALAEVRKQLAVHRVAPLQAIASQLSTVDLDALAALLGKVAELMDGDAQKPVFANYAKALPGLPGQVEAAIKTAKAQAGV